MRRVIIENIDLMAQEEEEELLGTLSDMNIEYTIEEVEA